MAVLENDVRIVAAEGYDEPFDIWVLMNAVEAIFRQTALEKGLLFTVEVFRHVPDFMVGDVLHIREILVRLIANAMEFTTKGGVCVGCGLQRHDEDRILLRFTVADTGNGMNEEELKQFLELAGWADAGRPQAHGRAAPGLSAITALVNVLEGEICAKSLPDQGTTVSFTCMVRSFQEGIPATSLH